VRRYAEVGKDSREAIARYADDVRSGRFPAPDESYGVARPAEEPVGKVYG
jgi:ketopantoate hydroxymethyltransferase